MYYAYNARSVQIHRAAERSALARGRKIEAALAARSAKVAREALMTGYRQRVF